MNHNFIHILENYNFNYSAEKLYDFVWHEFADKYIEEIKLRMSSTSLDVMEENFGVILKLLHPFMPFVTEELWSVVPSRGYATAIPNHKMLIVENWPIMK